MAVFMYRTGNMSGACIDCVHLAAFISAYQEFNCHYQAGKTHHRLLTACSKVLELSSVEPILHKLVLFPKSIKLNQFVMNLLIQYHHWVEIAITCCL